MKRKVALLMVAMATVGTMAGCGAKPEKEVLGKVNGVAITRGDLGKELTAVEDQVIQGYIDEKLLEEFYKGIKVEKAEIDAQVAVVKGQIGDENWATYLMYSGFENEDAFRDVVKAELQKEKKRQEYVKDLKLTDSDIKAHYEANPERYNNLKGKAVFLDTDEELEQARKLKDEGKTIEEIAKEMEKDMREEEYVSFEFDGFDKPITTAVVDDFLITGPESGARALVKVAGINNTYEQVAEDVKKDIESLKAQEKVDKELEEFYKKAKIEIRGKVQDGAKQPESPLDAEPGATSGKTTVDSEGHVIDENGNHVVEEEGSIHTEEETTGAEQTE